MAAEHIEDLWRWCCEDMSNIFKEIFKIIRCQNPVLYDGIYACMFGRIISLVWITQVIFQEIKKGTLKRSIWVPVDHSFPTKFIRFKLSAYTDMHSAWEDPKCIPFLPDTHASV